ncbi:MAG: ATP-binding protein, partial [Actinomycetota bacterium]|nr:ATP-binding protein [Actinomycetota bacterium]
MLTIGDLVEVAPVDTVVRLDGPGGRLPELVLTGDVVHSLSAILEAAGSTAGAGFFVVGPFGSGKSHFLAALGELLADPQAAADLGGWDANMRTRAQAARPSLAVRVPLVEYRAQAALEDVVLGRGWRGVGSASTGEPAQASDRLAAWDGLLAAARAEGHAGMVLLLDELSEFLRAKQGPALTEDLRFLQFLGEWAATRPVVVVCAVQESIEEVANVSQRELARIRDRYRPSLTLSMRHVEDLVRGRLVKVRPGADPAIARAQREIDAAFPGWRVTPERFARCYPLHPDTLTLLEGLRFLLSQQRGVVDFICRQLAGDPAAGIEPWLARGYRELLTPDRVYDHFQGRLHERVETARLADAVVPYYQRAVEELFDDETDRALALRTVKLLCLLAASPLERPRSAAELAAMLVTEVSDLDPAANIAYLERAILEPLVARGAFVVAKPGPPTTFGVELEADAAVVAANRVNQARTEISPADRRQVATLVRLGSSPTLPLQVVADVGIARRELLWHNTLRSVLVGTARLAELSAQDAADAVSKARAASAEGCLLIGEVELS